jgi:hypothetical protein
MQEIIITSLPQYIESLGNINQGKRAIYRGQRRNRPLLPKLARLRTYLPLLQAEQAMLSDFKARSLPLLNVTPTNDFDWLALMQHYGLATRLLDWSVNPLAALWFTVRRTPVDEQPGVVWLFQPRSSDYLIPAELERAFNINQTRLFQPKVITPRIGSQWGWFTAHYFRADQEQFVSLESDPTYSPRLSKLLIPPDKFALIRFQLDRLGMNSAMLFPDLEGLCEHIEWLYSALGDEEGYDNEKVFIFEDL